MSLSDLSGAPTALSPTHELTAWLAEHSPALFGPDALTDATREDLAMIVRRLTQAAATLSNLASLASTELAALMESDTETVGRFHLRRTRPVKTEWDAAAWRRAVIDAAWQRSADDAALPVNIINPETGEVLPVRMVLGNAMRLAFGCVTPSTAPSVNGLKALDLNPGDYRATTPGAWRVTVDEDGSDD